MTLAILVVHSVIVYPVNLSHLRSEVAFKETKWLGKTQNPSTELSLYAQRLGQESIILGCTDGKGQFSKCMYSDDLELSLLYGSVVGLCTWNRLNCRNFYIKDSSNLQPLGIDYWQRR